MKSKPLIILTFSLLVLSQLATGMSLSTVTVTPDQETSLVIATRHDSTIYQRFAQGFADSSYGESVGITSANQLEFLTPTTYDAYSTALTHSAIGASIAWGGGSNLFNQLMADGLFRTLDNQSLVDHINANISDSIGGAALKGYDSGDNLKWVGANLATFGFTVNNQTLQERGLPFPTSFMDLGSPEYYTSSAEHNIGIANAPDSTSVTKIYQIILQKYGWETGWTLINAIAGNSQVYGGSVETRAAVESGEVAVALTIDFYGLIAMGVNPNTQFVLPDNETIIDTDPIAIANNAPNVEAARAFMKYVLSNQGQALWLDDRINRLPVRGDAFDAAHELATSDPNMVAESINRVEALYNQAITANTIDFNITQEQSQNEAMRYYFESTITNVHADHRNTWADLTSAFKAGSINESQFVTAFVLFGYPVINQDEAIAINDQIISDVTFRQNSMAEWENWAYEKNQAVLDYLSGEPTTTITTVTTSVSSTSSSSAPVTVTVTGTATVGSSTTSQDTTPTTTISAAPSTTEETSTTTTISSSGNTSSANSTTPQSESSPELPLSVLPVSLMIFSLAVTHYIRRRSM